jgi:hypothetical protein
MTDIDRRRAKLEADIRRLYFRFLAEFEDSPEFEEVENLLLRGQTEQAIALIEEHMDAAFEDFEEQVQQAAKSESRALGLLLGAALFFSITSDDLRNLIVSSRANLLQRIKSGQRRAIDLSLIEAYTSGRRLAPAVRDAIGLSAPLVNALDNYRSILRRQNQQDAEEGRRGRMTEAQITRMVEAYRKNLQKIRARQISRDTATRVVAESQDLALRQAVSQGALEESKVIRVWNRIPDDRVRDAHDVMQGQRAGLNETFTDGSGNELRFPGDPRAPGETTINCRCTLRMEIK